MTEPVPLPKKRGRKPLTAEERAARKRFSNITVDSELNAILNRKADELVSVFGFRPTLSQTLRYILKASQL